MSELPDGLVLALIGLAIGAVFGLAARRARFCTLGALEDALYGRDPARLRMWAMAIAVALIGTQTLVALGALDPEQTRWGRQEFRPLASLGGALLFGYGMALAGNCGFGALARMGGGDVRSALIVLVMGVSAFAVFAGPLAPLRVAVVEVSGAPLGNLVSGHLPGALALALSLAVAALAAIWALGGGPRRDRGAMLGWSVAVGLAVTAAWALTHWLAVATFDATPVIAPTFTAPLGETLLFAMTADGLGDLGFGVGTTLGVVLGAFVGSWQKGQFRWEVCDDARELGRQCAGAAMMGVGGVVAVGCSVGQGLSAVSLATLSGPLTLAGIALGGAIGLRHLIRGLEPAE